MESADDVFEDLVIDGQVKRQLVRGLGPAPFALKAKDARVLAVIGLPEQLREPVVGMCAVQQGLQLAVMFRPAVLADA